jgi:hypothetical protein
LEEVPFVLELWHWAFLFERPKPKTFFAFVGFYWLECTVVVMPVCVLGFQDSLFAARVVAFVRTATHGLYVVVSSHR